MKRKVTLALAGCAAFALASALTWEPDQTRALRIGWVERASAQSDAPVKIMAFNPTAKKLAIAIAKRVEILDASTGAVTAALEGHPSWIVAVAYSKKGSRLASADQSGNVKVWDGSGRPVRDVVRDDRSQAVEALAMSPDGRRVAAGGISNVRIWEVASGKLLATLPTERVKSLAFSPSGGQLAIGGDNLEIVEPPTGKPQLVDGTRAATEVAWSPDGTRVAGSSSYGHYYLVNASTRQVESKRYEEDRPHKARAIAFSADGRSLICLVDRGIDWLELPSLNRRTSWQLSGAAESFAYSPEHKLIATSHAEQTVNLLDAEAGEARLIKTIRGKAGSEAVAERATTAHCEGKEYQEACEDKQLDRHYWDICRKGKDHLNRYNHDKRKEWAEAARSYPAVRAAYTRFKEKWEPCYRKKHSCRAGDRVDECLSAGDAYKEAFRDLLDAIKTEIGYALTRAKGAIEHGRHASARSQGASADEWLAQAEELNRIELVKTDLQAIRNAVAELRNTTAGMADKAKAEEEEKWKPFTSILSGDRLRFFNSNYRAGANVYGRGGKRLTTPGAFKKAPVMCYYTVDRNRILPRWETTCYRFRGSKYAGPPSIRNGSGDRPPSSAFR